jgi:hypothetical protein
MKAILALFAFSLALAAAQETLAHSRYHEERGVWAHYFNVSTPDGAHGVLCTDLADAHRYFVDPSAPRYTPTELVEAYGASTFLFCNVLGIRGRTAFTPQELYYVLPSGERRDVGADDYFYLRGSEGVVAEGEDVYVIIALYLAPGDHATLYYRGAAEEVHFMPLD